MPFAVSERKRMIELDSQIVFCRPRGDWRPAGRAEFWIHTHAPISLAAPIMGQSDNCHNSVE